MHIPDPVKAARGNGPRCAPGGRVLVDEVDFETVTIDAPNRSLARRIVNVWCDGFRDGWLGRRMPRFFRDAGLHAIAVVPMTLVLNAMLTHPIIGRKTVARGRHTAPSLPPRGSLAAFPGRRRTLGHAVLHADGFIVCGTK